ncbi:peptidoglycan D,D-transpeptidase FtsI family protein [Nocardioides cavernaquae]|uniref:Penicillin-binding protein 2 n=1 Tax=Nocardioides cavernaquae TaxID=2321396 RepID=A0A3A5H566_9ACTN|nr:penicillin-binding protein 2 [Nocardioides cavernaquae]RJS45829.1 penicillin-binding protein 2 [Nocardioides cavernaquae]
MNKPIRTLSLFCGLLFLVLLGNATYLQYVKADDLNGNSLNRRVIEASFARERGAILVDGDPVAESKKSDDRYEWQRTYPRPALFAHVTGWFSFFSQSGIERAENDVLSGDDPQLFVTRLVDLLSNAQPKGGSVELTLDPAAQRAAYDGLLALGEGTQGSVVALEPATGRVLAMVSVPSFDPNKLASHDLTSVRDADAALNARKDQPKLNRAIQTTLPPGSTFKLVTAAAAIEEGLYGPESQVPAGASYQLPLTSNEAGRVTNATGNACNPSTVTLKFSLEWSCNTTFAKIADELGVDKMREMSEKFGFNDTSLLDLPGQAKSAYPGDLDRAQTGLSGFGQSNVRATPLQMAMVAAGIANRGEVMRPHLVDEIRSPDFDSLGKSKNEVYSRAISAATARQLTDMMVGVVDQGTAGTARIPGIRVAGKTGTAQTGRDDIANYAWFVSFAPADDPQIAVAVMIQNSNRVNSEISGGGLGGPIAKAVMEAVINR